MLRSIGFRIYPAICAINLERAGRPRCAKALFAGARGGYCGDVKLVFAPIGIVAGLLAGLAAKKGFARLWAIFDNEDPPGPDQWGVPYPRLLTSLAVEGALSRLTKGAVNHGVRIGFERMTGVWPGEDGWRGDRATARTMGAVAKTTRHSRDTSRLNDPALAAKVESEMFRPADAPKKSVDVNVAQRVVYLRGQVKSTEQMESLVAKAREIDGVSRVENLLHLPGEPARHKG